MRARYPGILRKGGFDPQISTGNANNMWKSDYPLASFEEPAKHRLPCRINRAREILYSPILQQAFSLKI